MGQSEKSVAVLDMCGMMSPCAYIDVKMCIWCMYTVATRKKRTENLLLLLGLTDWLRGTCTTPSNRSSSSIENQPHRLGKHIHAPCHVVAYHVGCLATCPAHRALAQALRYKDPQI